MKLTKEEVAIWIRDLIPYIQAPMILSPKGCFNDTEYEAMPGGIIEYDTCLIPTTPKAIEQTENLKALIDLYKIVESDDESLEQEIKYLKDCCIRAGEELSKNSFKWDGKEKNLVVQAKQLNVEYEKELKFNQNLLHNLMKDYKYDGPVRPTGFTPDDVINHLKQRAKIQLTPEQWEKVKEADDMELTEEQFKAIDEFITRTNKDCTTCSHSELEDGIYLSCDIDGIQNDIVKNCSNYEEKK